MKETNKLLADFVGKKVEWSEGYGSWFITTEVGGIEQFWNPDLDWNQLHLVIDKIKERNVDNEFMLKTIQNLLDTPIGCNMLYIYNKVYYTVTHVSYESTVNLE